MTEHQQAATQAARGLTAALDTMSARLEEIREGSEARTAALAVYGRRNRRLIVITLVSVVLDVALTIALAVVAISAHDASIAARKASASNLALCQAGNVGRHQQIALWSFALSLPHPERQTAQQKKNAAAFEAYLRKIYAPRDCGHLRASRDGVKP